MKKLKLFLSLIVLCLAMGVNAQNNHFNYQAVLRDASGNIMDNQTANLSFTILKGSASGTNVYKETQNTTTNAQGLINLEIGGGTVVSGSFNNINWSNDAYFLNVKLDGTDLGTSEFKYVPYANYAENAGNVEFVNESGVVHNSTNTASDNFVFGSNTLDDQAGTDDDVRFFFDKSKGAFRAGSMSNDGWNDANVGGGSFASGFDCVASGIFSVATGQSSTASGYNSTAMGGLATASGYGSTAFGIATTASGAWSTSLGLATKAQSSFETVIGLFNDTATTFESEYFDYNDRLFSIGNGVGDSLRSNAVTVLKNGNTGIGTTTPSQKLDVNGAIKVSQTTSTPERNVVYGNSLPLAYGRISSGIYSSYGISSLSHPSTGVYVITLSNSWLYYPTVLITCEGTEVEAFSTIKVVSYSTNGFGGSVITVRIVDWSGGGRFIDSPFSIVVYDSHL